MAKGDELNESAQLNGGMFFTLSAAYAFFTVVSLIQFIRIQSRSRTHGWSTRKVFILMNIFVNGVRAAVFRFHMIVVLKPKVLTSVLVELPGLLFFSTYTLLVVFGAEIWYQAKGFPADRPRACYVSANCVIYVIQVLIWISLWLYDNSFVGSMSQVFIAVVSIIAASGFLLFGGRLYTMLFNIPVQSKGRQQKLHQVKSVTAICFTSFLIRCITAAVTAFNVDASLKVLDHPTAFDLIYYMLVEMLPCALVLFNLRKLPPRHVWDRNHPSLQCEILKWVRASLCWSLSGIGRSTSTLLVVAYLVRCFFPRFDLKVRWEFEARWMDGYNFTSSSLYKASYIFQL
ncbi:tobamovirus multiplication protein 1-like isoform X2 [Silene latifolia]|uniref:tobamovirus multiplication protein 1-like isoform X2 n=1 Tax=Silene latifolia TaxID=37657 RepID=UPI003D78800C